MGVLAKVIFNRRYAIYGEEGLKFTRGNELAVVHDVSDDPSQVLSRTFIDIDGDDTTDAVVDNRNYKLSRFCTSPVHAYIIRQDRKGLASFFEALPAFVEFFGSVDHHLKEARDKLEQFKRTIASKAATTRCNKDFHCTVGTAVGGKPTLTLVYHEKGSAPYYLPDGKEIEKDYESVTIVMQSSAQIVVYGEEAGKIWQQLNKK